MKNDQKREQQSKTALESIREFLAKLGRPSTEIMPASDSVPELEDQTRGRFPDPGRFNPNRFSRLMGLIVGFAIPALVIPMEAHAADLEGTLRNLVTAFTGRLLPVLAMGYLGKNIFSHVAGDPNAKHESIRVVIGIACLLGLAGVWNFIASQAR